MNDLKIAKNILLNNDYTIVLVSNQTVIFTSEAKGVRPLIDFYESNQWKNHASISSADKIIGKASIMLSKLCQIKKIYTPIISQSAFDYSKQSNIFVEYDKVVDRIQNRTKDGFCPMETLALDSNDSKILYKKVLNFYKSLKQT